MKCCIWSIRFHENLWNYLRDFGVWNSRFGVLLTLTYITTRTTVQAVKCRWCVLCALHCARPQFHSTESLDMEQSSCWPSSRRHFSRKIQTHTEEIFVCSVTVDSAHWLHYVILRYINVLNNNINSNMYLIIIIIVGTWQRAVWSNSPVASESCECRWVEPSGRGETVSTWNTVRLQPLVCHYHWQANGNHWIHICLQAEVW